MFPPISNIGENHYDQVFRASPRANTLKTSGTCLSILVWLDDNFFQIRAAWQCFNVTKTCPQGGKDPLVHWYLAFGCQQYHITTPFLRGVCLIVVGVLLVLFMTPLAASQRHLLPLRPPCSDWAIGGLPGQVDVMQLPLSYSRVLQPQKQLCSWSFLGIVVI